VWTASSCGGTDFRHAEVNAGALGGEVAHGFKLVSGGGSDQPHLDTLDSADTQHKRQQLIDSGGFK
jgi:hypothetical protein